VSTTTGEAEVAAKGAVPGAPDCWTPFQLLPKGIESPYHMVLPEKLGALIGHLAKGERVEEALDLARVLLAVLQASDCPLGSTPLFPVWRLLTGLDPRLAVRRS